MSERYAPDVWDATDAPGGYVCGACGVPTESEPCAQHQHPLDVAERCGEPVGYSGFDCDLSRGHGDHDPRRQKPETEPPTETEEPA